MTRAQPPDDGVRPAGADKAGRRASAVGFIAAALLTTAVMIFAYSWPPFGWVIPLLAGWAGARLSRSRAAWTLWATIALLTALALVVAYTPAVYGPAALLVQREQPVPADAIVVLSDAVTPEGRLDSVALARLLGGLELAREGYAPVLVRTVLPLWDAPPADADVSALTGALAPGVAVEAVGPVSSTRSEALKVLDLYRERGWSRVLLVTSPLHSARAAAAFRKAGMTVVSCPCPERDYWPEGSHGRLYMLRRCVYEWEAWAVYKCRGWV